MSTAPGGKASQIMGGPRDDDEEEKIGLLGNENKKPHAGKH